MQSNNPTPSTLPVIPVIPVGGMIAIRLIAVIARYAIIQANCNRYVVYFNRNQTIQMRTMQLMRAMQLLKPPAIHLF